MGCAAPQYSDKANSRRSEATCNRTLDPPCDPHELWGWQQRKPLSDQPANFNSLKTKTQHILRRQSYRLALEVVAVLQDYNLPRAKMVSIASKNSSTAWYYVNLIEPRERGLSRRSPEGHTSILLVQLGKQGHRLFTQRQSIELQVGSQALFRGVGDGRAVDALATTRGYSTGK